MRKLSRRTTILTIGMALVLVTGLLAYAFVTAGSGEGSVAVSGGSGDITVHQNDPGPLTPGATVNLTGTVDNNGNSPVTVQKIIGTLSVDNGQNDPDLPACDDDDFSLSGVGLVSPNPVQPGAAMSTWSGIQLTMVNKPRDATTYPDPRDDPNNQDNCKNATVKLSYTVV